MAFPLPGEGRKSEIIGVRGVGRKGDKILKDEKLRKKLDNKMSKHIQTGKKIKAKKLRAG
jgi:hypothetical protein